jgi:3-hydroxy-9,10-secoandrosta-1,3,5(10)-triene-9,17-dione monooxygenase reductase component
MRVYGHWFPTDFMLRIFLEFSMQTAVVSPIDDRDLFKSVSSQWPSGVAVITTLCEKGRPHGLTMSAVISLSLEPMQFLISVDKRSATLPIIKRRGRFAINLLSKSQEDVGMRFASKSEDKFSRLDYRLSALGLPVIEGAVATISCDIYSVLPGGDHELIVGDVIDIEHFGGDSLIHYKRAFHSVATS